MITEVTFKLRPLPTRIYYSSALVDTLSNGIDALQIIGAKNLPLEFLQLINLKYKEVTYWILLIRAAGTEAELHRIHDEIRTAADLYLNADFNANHEHPQSLDGRQLQQVPREPIFNAELRFGCVSSKLPIALSVLNSASIDTQFISLNGGTVLFAPLTDSDAARIAADFEKLGVNFAFENVVGVNIPNRWGTPRPEWAIMRQLKSALDPAGIMNPGRFVV